MEEISSSKIIVQDLFWSPRLTINAQRAIFHQWEQLEASGCIDNFRILAGQKGGFREGWFFADSDAYKWLDAAARISIHHPDPKLTSLMDEFIHLLGLCQSPDGYLFTYNQIHFPDICWANLQIEHELYCHGHLIEAGVSHYQASGQTNMLNIARRAADLLVRDFLGARPERTPGHEEIEIALLRLYRLTGETSYLDLARHFLEQRGRTKLFALSILRQNSSVSARARIVGEMRQAYNAANPGIPARQLPPGNYAKRPLLGTQRWFVSALAGKYFQQHAPIREQTVPVGHAVRFGYLETAAAMLQRIDIDPTLLRTLEKAWERMVTRRMYVTGGIGSLPALEGFGRDYELDPEYAYAETCAALASMFWNWEMALCTQAAQYSELFEWQLYNASAVGMGLSGENYLYNNPLVCRGSITRKAWFAVPCCPSNLARTWADLGKYIFSLQGNALWIHQYIGCRAKLNPGIPLELAINSELPWNGRVRINVFPEQPVDLTFYLRLPAWSASTSIHVLQGGEVQKVAAASLEHDRETGRQFESTAQGYDPRQGRFIPLRRVWSPGDAIDLEFDLPIQLRRAHPKIRGQRGMVALTRGPLVYCLESVDHPDLDIFSARLIPATLHAEHLPELLGGITVLRGQTTNKMPLTFIPYSLWANRGESQMTVWVRE